MNAQVNTPLWTTMQRRLAVVFALLPIIGAVVLFLQGFRFDDLTGDILAAWVTCLVVYVLADLMVGPREDGFWAGYMNLSALVAWLILGVGPALMLTFIGTLLAAAIRWRNGISTDTILDIGIGRIAITGINVILAHGICEALGWQFADAVSDTSQIWMVYIPLLLSFIITQCVGYLLSQLPDVAQMISTRRLIWEVVPFIVIPAIALTYERVDTLAFVAVMGLVGTQIIRYRQLTGARDSLMQRVRELSIINQTGARISTSLVMDDVLGNIYGHIAELIAVKHLYVALYDSDRDLLRYELVRVNGQTTHWSNRRLTTEGNQRNVTDEVIRTKSLIHISSPAEMLARHFVLPQTLDFNAYLGIPLKTGGKVIGVLAVMKDTRFSHSEISVLQTIANQVNLGIRNTMLYGDSVALAQNLSRINASLQKIMFNMDYEEALTLSCETALEITDTQKVAIFLQSTQHNARTYLATHLGLTDAHRALLDRSLHQPGLEQSDTLVIDDIKTLPDDSPLREQANIGDFRALLQVPLKSTSIIVGYMTVYYEDAHPNNSTHVQLMESLAYQLTAALDNAELLKTLETYATEQTQLVNLSRVVNSSLDLNTIITTFNDMLRKMMKVEKAWIGLMDSPDVMMMHSGKDDPEPLLVQSLPEIRKMMTHAKPSPRICYQQDTISDRMRDTMIYFEVNMLAFIPMLSGNEVLGVVMLGESDQRMFNDGEWRLLDLATNQVATQIKNARLYDETQTALNRRLQQLALIEDIAQQISGALDAKEMIQNVLNASGMATQAELAELALINESGEMDIIGQIKLHEAWDTFTVTRSADSGLMGLAIQSKKPLIVPDNNAYTEYIADTDVPLKSSLIVPMIMEDRVIGALNIESIKPDFFQEEHLEFAKSLAGHAVISIQNARLLQERQRRIDVLTSLRDLAVRLSGDPSQEAVIGGILRTALDNVDGDEAVLVMLKDDAPQVLGGMRADEDHLTDTPLTVPHPLIAQVMAEGGEILLIDDIHTNTAFNTLEPAPAYESAIVAPVKHGSDTQMVLFVAFNTGRHLSHVDLNAIELLTIQAAALLENVGLVERLRTETNRMSAILESARDGIIMLDRTGKLVLANTSAEHLLDMSMDDFVGEHFATTLIQRLQSAGSQPDSLQDALREMARVLRLEPTSITTRSLEIALEDSVRYIEEVGSPVVDSLNQIIGRLLTLRDVSEEKELEAYRDEITHMVVHDLRRPLSSIITSIDAIMIILEDFGDHESVDVVKQILGVSMDSANSLLNLVDTLLDIAKMEKPGFMILNPQVTAIESMAHDAIRHLASFIDAAQIKVEIDVPDHVPAINVDSDLILRVIRNLLDNAVRYAPTGGKVLIDAKLYPRDQVLIRVSDNGRGIPPAEGERIFDKYRQIKDNIPAHGGKGTGLGLTFCKQAVEAHQGKIWVEQDGPLPGACFAFTLPIAQADATNSNSTMQRETTPNSNPLSDQTVIE